MIDWFPFFRLGDQTLRCFFLFLLIIAQEEGNGMALGVISDGWLFA